MLDEKTSKIANELFNQSHSNLEAPLIGRVYVPICKSCRNLIERRDIGLPRCQIFGDIPREYRLAFSDECPHYVIIDNCPEAFKPVVRSKTLSE